VLSYLGRTGINHFRVTAVCGDFYIGGRQFDSLQDLIGGQREEPETGLKAVNVYFKRGGNGWIPLPCCHRGGKTIGFKLLLECWENDMFISIKNST